MGSVIESALETMPVVVLSGMRQTGKSTLLQQDSRFKRRRYISLDDFAFLEAARRNPESLLEGDDQVTVDEAQKCPELLVAIKRMVDQKRIPGRFILSGSANFSLLKGVSESLAGRAVYLPLYPFSYRELHSRVADPPFLSGFFHSQELSAHISLSRVAPDEILRGGMPSVCLANQKGTQFWFKGYEQTYLQRDLREVSSIQDVLSFRNVLKLAALRSGQILNASELGRDAKLNNVTVSRYLSVAETAFLIRRLPPYLANRASRLIKSPKLFFTDAGFACHMAGVSSLNSTDDEPLRGAMVETWVAQNLASIIDAHMPGAELCFWNVQGRHEVDFVISMGRESVAIEIKSGNRWKNEDLAGLQAFVNATPSCKAAILAYNGTEAVNLGEKCWAIPLALLLS